MFENDWKGGKSECKIISVLWLQIHVTQVLPGYKSRCSFPGLNDMGFAVPYHYKAQRTLSGYVLHELLSSIFILSLSAPNQDNTNILPKATDPKGTEVTLFPSAFTVVKSSWILQIIKNKSFLILKGSIPIQSLDSSNFVYKNILIIKLFNVGIIVYSSGTLVKMQILAH